MTVDAGVVVVGSLTVDFTSWSERPPYPGETILGTDFSMVAGGKGANQVLMAAKMGSPTWMIGCVGEDTLHNIVLDELAAAGVDTGYVRICPGQKTGIAHIRVIDGSGENSIVVVPLANRDLSTHHVEAAVTELAAERRVGVMLVQLEIPPETAMYALRAGHDKGMLTVLDPAPATDLPLDIYRYVDVVTPNESEATAITGIDVVDLGSAHHAAQWFIEHGTTTAIVTLGANGVLAATAEGFTHFPGLAVQAIDTTAAGDGFAGAFGAALSQGDLFKEAVMKGVAAGALTVGKAGASSSLPSRHEVQGLLDSLA